MQILITIPDGVYSYVQEQWSDVDLTIDTPLNHIMRGILDGKIIKDNDAISRSKLKEEFADIRKDFPKFHQYNLVSTADIARKIDIAPAYGRENDK